MKSKMGEYINKIKDGFKLFENIKNVTQTVMNYKKETEQNLTGINNNIEDSKMGIQQLKTSDVNLTKFLEGCKGEMDLKGEFLEDKNSAIELLTSNLDQVSNSMKDYSKLLENNVLTEALEGVAKLDLEGMLKESTGLINGLLVKIGLEKGLNELFNTELGQKILEVVAFALSIIEDIATIVKNVQSIIQNTAEIVRLVAELASVISQIVSACASSWCTFGASLIIVAKLIFRAAVIGTKLFKAGKSLFDSGVTIFNTTKHLLDFKNKKLDGEKAKQFLTNKISQGVTKIADWGINKVTTENKKTNEISQINQKERNINDLNNKITDNRSTISNLNTQINQTTSQISNEVGQKNSTISSISNLTSQIGGIMFRNI